jgi:Family of unknown function (DUF6869)
VWETPDPVFGWWEYQRLLRGSPEERRALEAGHPAGVFASLREVNAIVARGGRPALVMIPDLLDAAPTEWSVVLVGEGPLDALIKKHGNSLIADLEDLAGAEPRFLHALSGVLLAHGVLAPDVEKRLSQWISIIGTPDG